MEAKSPLLLILVAMLFSANAWAESYICKYYKDHLPSAYDSFCKKGSSRSRSSGARASLASSFKSNPSNLPTQPSNYGFESLGHYLRSAKGTWSPQFSLVKGYRKFGAGLSTGNNNTFYGNDILQRIKGPAILDTFRPQESYTGTFPTFNFGTAFALYRGKATDLNLGLSTGYNRITDTWGGGGGLSFGWWIFTISAGATREKVSNDFGPVFIPTASLGIKIPFIELEYSYLENIGGPHLSPVQVGTLTLQIGRLMLTGAVRKLDYRREGYVTQRHLAAQMLLSKKVAVGYLYNYIPGANTLAMQIFL